MIITDERSIVWYDPQWDRLFVSDGGTGMWDGEFHWPLSFADRPWLVCLGAL